MGDASKQTGIAHVFNGSERGTALLLEEQAAILPLRGRPRPEHQEKGQEKGGRRCTAANRL
jgi:hypothetical protein